MIEIKSLSGRVLYTAKSAADVRTALAEAVGRGADLRGADLYGADLYGADLRGANLYGANLYGADLRGAENIPTTAAAQTIVATPEGSIIGWKKAQGHIVKLKIPAKAKRSNATGRKCRASEAKVLAIYNSDGTEAAEAFSSHDPECRYVVGEKVYPDSFDDDRWNECAPGIHFFITREEAEAY